MKELLEKLKSLDPTAYAAFVDTELGKYDCHDDYGKMTEYIYQDRLINKAQMAWLQACLQDAILTKGWHFQQLAREGRCVVDITVFEPKCDIIDGPERKTPAEAMLAAYIAACEATP